MQCEEGNRHLVHVETGHRPVSTFGPELEIELIAIYKCEQCGRIVTGPLQNEPAPEPAPDPRPHRKGPR